MPLPSDKRVVAVLFHEAALRSVLDRNGLIASSWLRDVAAARASVEADLGLLGPPAPPIASGWEPEGLSST